MRRVLIANIFGIGDVLFTTPLASNLIRQFPDVKIDYVCNARAKDVLADNDDINHIFVYEKDDYLRLWRKSKREFSKTLWKYYSDVKANKYDAVFDFTFSRKSGLFFWAAGIPERIGLDYKKRGIFLTKKKTLEGFEGKHVVEFYLDLLNLIDIKPEAKRLKLIPDSVETAWAKEYLARKGLRSKDFIAIIPGGGRSWGQQASRKRMAPDIFSEVGDQLSGQDYKVAILGDIFEKELCLGIAGKMSNKPFFIENDVPLKKYIALLNESKIVICNDGGPLHMAVALGKKTVSIFGPVDEIVYGPYPFSDKHRVIARKDVDCRPCYDKFKLPECTRNRACVDEIKAADIVEAVESLGV